MAFKEISPYELGGNVFHMLDKDWALATAGPAEGCNTMTVSWGGLGVLWNNPVATIYVRPHRYTYQFTEREDYFTLSFFGGGFRRQLALLGAKSGRDGDKIAEAGLTVANFAGQAAFEEAQLVLVCRKAYRQPLEEGCFVDASLVEKNYPERDFHIMYIGIIEKVYIQQ